MIVFRWAKHIGSSFAQLGRDVVQTFRDPEAATARLAKEVAALEEHERRAKKAYENLLKREREVTEQVASIERDQERLLRDRQLRRNGKSPPPQ